MLLMIDNYDSFTFNVVQYLMELGAAVEVHRNDEITVEAIQALGPPRHRHFSRALHPERSRRVHGRYRTLRRQDTDSRHMPRTPEYRTGRSAAKSCGQSG